MFVGGEALNMGRVVVDFAGRLLNHMRQLVSQQSPTFDGFRSVAIRGKHYIRTHGVSQGIHGARRVLGLSIRMNSHSAEILSEARLHESPRGWIKRPAR